VARDGSLVVEAMTRAQSLFPWLIRGADFDNDSAFMNDMVVPWCREQKIEVTRSARLQEERPGVRGAEERRGGAPFSIWPNAQLITLG